MEEAGIYFQQELGFTPLAELYILAPKHWKNFAAKPLHDVYGFPHNVDKGRLVIAAENNAFWRSYLPDMDALPEHLATQVRIAYGRTDGSYSMMPFFDLLALHEMGHSYTAQAGLKMHRYWMGELFVNIMLHTFVAENSRKFYLHLKLSRTLCWEQERLFTSSTVLKILNDCIPLWAWVQKTMASTNVCSTPPPRTSTMQVEKM